MKIILVEDHPALAEISCHQLREIYGHDVRSVADGSSTMAAVAAFQPDLVLIDLHLPDMNGYDVAAAIRADPRWSSVLLVVVTGFGGEVDSTLAASVGIDAHFRKPMDFALLPEIKRRAA